MPRTALSVQQVSRAAITPSYVTPDVAGSSILNTGSEMFHVKTGGTGATVTVPIPVLVDGKAVASQSYVLGTNTERMIGPFPPAIYNQADGSVYIDYSSITTVTAAAFKVT